MQQLLRKQTEKSTKLEKSQQAESKSKNKVQTTVTKALTELDNTKQAVAHRDQVLSRANRCAALSPYVCVAIC